LNAVWENTTPNRTKIPSASGISMARRWLSGSEFFRCSGFGEATGFYSIHSDLASIQGHYKAMRTLGLRLLLDALLW
jgi:hypothetical protein